MVFVLDVQQVLATGKANFLTDNMEFIHGGYRSTKIVFASIHGVVKL